MKIKVCGLRESDDLLAVSSLPVDILGFVFHEGSPRNAYYHLDADVVKLLPRSMGKAGVFVDEDIDRVKEVVAQFELTHVQLHGKETPDYCAQLTDEVQVIKAFAVHERFSFTTLQAYSDACHLFLFDAPGELPGGNGTRFDWNRLMHYDGHIPFLLSGGIGPEHIHELMSFYHPRLLGFDINSRFEIFPGKKNTEQISRFVKSIKAAGYELPGY